MAEILIEIVPEELYSELNAIAKKSGLTLQQAVIKALESYVEFLMIEARLEKINQRGSISIDPAEIANIINEERNKR